jgi:hypothetical protein
MLPNKLRFVRLPTIWVPIGDVKLALQRVAKLSTNICSEMCTVSILLETIFLSPATATFSNGRLVLGGKWNLSADPHQLDEPVSYLT